MSYRSCIRALALAGVILTPTLAAAQTAGKAPPPPAPQKVDDATLDSRVEARLKADAALKKDTIDVAVSDGVVTLTGTVHSRGLRTRAERDHIDSREKRQTFRLPCLRDHRWLHAGLFRPGPAGATTVPGWADAVSAAIKEVVG